MNSPMMLSDTLSSRAVTGLLYQALETTDLGWIEKISTLFDSNQASETYPWLGMTPMLREWIGGRQTKGFHEHGITLVNKKYEATLVIQVKDLMRDKTGQIQIRINEMAQRSVNHWLRLIVDLIAAGETSACYDGQYFFDTDHEEGDSGSQSNIIEADVLDPTAPTATDLYDAIWSAIRRLVTVLDNEGEPLQPNVTRFHVAAPLRFFKTLQETFAAEIYGQRSQPFLPLEVMFTATPRLNWTDRLAVFAAAGNGVGAFIRQQELEPELSSLAEGSDHAFKNDEHLYGIKASRAVGYGMWQRAALIKLV